MTEVVDVLFLAKLSPRMFSIKTSSQMNEVQLTLKNQQSKRWNINKPFSFSYTFQMTTNVHWQQHYNWNSGVVALIPVGMYKYSI